MGIPPLLDVRKRVAYGGQLLLEYRTDTHDAPHGPIELFWMKPQNPDGQVVVIHVHSPMVSRAAGGSLPNLMTRCPFRRWRGSM